MIKCKCGEKLKFNKESQTFHCDYCFTDFDINMNEITKTEVFKKISQKNEELKHIKNEKLKVTCPYCNSNDCSRISNTDKIVNIALFGVFGNKRKHQWHCNNCQSNFG